MGYVYLGQSRIASIFKELPVETLIDTLCDKESIEELDIPEGVSSVGDYLFYNCPNLTKVIIPASVKNIGAGAFYNSDDIDNNIEVIEFNGPPPNTVGENAFPATSGIYKEEYVEDWKDILIKSDGYWNGLTFEVPESDETIVTYSDGSISSFNIVGEIAGTSSSPYYTTKIDNVQNAVNIKFNKAVTAIGDYAFYNCTALTSVTIPEGITSIGYAAFYNCSKLQPTTLPQSIIKLGDYAFYGTISVIDSYGNKYEGNSRLVYMGNSGYDKKAAAKNISTTVRFIAQSAFGNLTGSYNDLSDITLPSGLLSIGRYAFQYCKFETLNIPNTVYSIGYGAFSGCTNLTTITLSEHINEIGKYAFQGCNNLTLSIDKYITDITGMTNYPFGLNESQIVALKQGPYLGGDSN